MQELSPKKYIETKARKLPIYKCIINRDWASARIASIIVTRRHINGNVTAGLYLVDLLCLGIKDTSYSFNVDESEFFKGTPFKNFTMEIDYNLAHNIIYAGHDFALDFDIPPHPDFAITRFILEEDNDNDNIPLLDIPVGDEKGNPHLMIAPGTSLKYKYAYDKLLKNAGEGNFRYTIGMENYEEEHDYNDDDDEYEMEFANPEDLAKTKRIEEFEDGDINESTVRFIVYEDFLDEEKIKARSLLEQTSLRLEAALRILRGIWGEMPAEFGALLSKEFSLFDSSLDVPSWVNGQIEAGVAAAAATMDKFILAQKHLLDKDELERQVHDLHLNMANLYMDNPIVITYLYSKSVAMKMDKLEQLVKPTIKKMAMQYPIAKLYLALCTYFQGNPDPSIAYVLKAQNLLAAFPLVKTFSKWEYHTFWLTKILVNIEENNLAAAISQYTMVCEANMHNWLLPEVQFKLMLNSFKLIDQLRANEVEAK
ncbi:hypothetical protein [Parasediminibacterium sp. JCM 36343]|uniref:hypothetical protein n=1 Tax=Parasediminibacterium sp. JCM 36343 TaxID=3374279 RepID=UPI00397A2F67